MRFPFDKFLYKEKLLKLFYSLFSLKKWQLLAGTIFSAVLFAFIMNSIQSFIWWNYWSADLILIGTIDAIFIAGILGPILIALVGQTVKYTEYKRRVEEEARANAKLSVEEKKFRLYIENSVDAVTVVDTKGIIIYESPSVTRIFGYAPGELIGRSVFEFIHPGNLKKTLDLFKRASKEPFSVNIIELQFLKQNGEWAYIRASGKNMIPDPIIRGIILNVTDISERVEMESRLKRTIDEKDILMKEIHHRVKNNFMTVSNLLYLQADLVNDPKVTEVFLECQNRIKSMALIHEKLYQSETLSEVDIHSYVQRLISYIQSSYINTSANILIDLDINPAIKFGTEKAISIALIINELLSNIFKYAFPSNQNGIVQIRLYKETDNYRLTVKDDGVGFPEEYNAALSNSLGLKLVKMMSEQMRGNFTINSNSGTEFKIDFPD
ncbi:MAG: hypothetical protein CVV24_01925 [Ignavibacteriae bacterium HGW-Ignavibacteriae-3]|nr:MAG: hypothetical protein CVV24_01925 [Ignavibacteriae bacterium HGW-Ignavibacteriae-3]